MIIVTELRKKFQRKVVLKKLTFRTEGQVIGLVGPNGAGKTTLLRILAGVIKQDEGEICYKDQSKQEIQFAECRIGYLPQHFGLLKNYTLYEHMESFACMKGVPKTEWDRTIREILQMVHLEEVQDMKCGRLSGGMVRRAGIAQALLGNPDVVLLDEPTTGLDPEERIRFRNVIKEVKQKCTIMISTHMLEDVEKICEELIVLNDGRILYQGNIAALRKLAQDSHSGQEADKTDVQVEDGYMYVLKKDLAKSYAEK